MIRGHLRSTSQNPHQKSNIFMTNMHDDSKTSLLNLPSAKKLATKEALQNYTSRNYGGKSIAATDTFN